MRVSLLVLFGSWAAVAGAQVAIVDDPNQRARSLLASLTEVRSESFLDSAYGIYAKTKRIGQVEVTVGGTSSYDVLLKSEVELGATHTTTSESLELAPNFSLRRKTLRETVEGGERSDGEEDRTFADGEWLFRKVGGGGEQVARLQSTALHHDEFPSLLLLAHSIDPNLRASYRFARVGWQGEELAVEPLELRVEPDQTFTHRGKETRGGRIHVSRAGVAALVFYATATEVLQVEFLGTPLRLVKGTPRQVARDLPRKGEAAGEGTPKQVVLRYLRASVTGDVSELDTICDWEAIRVSESEDPWTAQATASEFGEHVKETLAEVGKDSGFPEEALGFLAIGLRQTVDGDSATVSMHGETTTFELRREGDSWVIVDRAY